jgi:hypothetical protein
MLRLSCLREGGGGGSGGGGGIGIRENERRRRRMSNQIHLVEGRAKA